MVRRCSDKMAKLLLVVFNALFLVCGIALLTVGLVDLKDVRSVEAILDDLNSVNILVIAVGAVIVIISFLGCCGALKENSCMLNAFLGLLLLILIAEIAVGYLAFTNKGQVESTIEEAAMKSLNRTASGDSKMLKQYWDDLQLTGKCCGVHGPKDYEALKIPLPESCCKGSERGTPCDRRNPNLQNTGCLPRIRQIIERNSLAIGVTAIIIAFIEVAGIIFACCLRSAINERYQTV
ncbi:CD63 antigen [Galendromus occidentalis]|uniref:Tetraspanin n=1 Tax=Galendromus occidentalis TaxID=34638 RepID=A0AAJ6QUE6_9ACAR|nr:CD63 antigen [Galendromus occidentalis]